MFPCHSVTCLSLHHSLYLPSSIHLTLPLLPSPSISPSSTPFPFLPSPDHVRLPIPILPSHPPHITFCFHSFYPVSTSFHLFSSLPPLLSQFSLPSPSFHCLSFIPFLLPPFPLPPFRSSLPASLFSPFLTYSSLFSSYSPPTLSPLFFFSLPPPAHPPLLSSSTFRPSLFVLLPPFPPLIIPSFPSSHLLPSVPFTFTDFPCSFFPQTVRPPPFCS
ncbi:unnamed protein product [Dicrocoelium dendriticum]|nr:unnamed protein product [Dicrocoelium dendriticum]